MLIGDRKVPEVSQSAKRRPITLGRASTTVRDLGERSVSSSSVRRWVACMSSLGREAVWQVLRSLWQVGQQPSCGVRSTRGSGDPQCPPALFEQQTAVAGTAGNGQEAPEKRVVRARGLSLNSKDSSVREGRGSCVKISAAGWDEVNSQSAERDEERWYLLASLLDTLRSELAPHRLDMGNLDVS